jgi:Family of unknown function (DUF6283)
MTKIRSESCTACPYRRDVPSGVWAASEYDKLADYDGETFDQPVGVFHCHATTEFICHGWAVVHGRQEHDLLGLRLLAGMGGFDFAQLDEVEEHAPLFSSGAEAAEHGKRDIKNPSAAAKEVVRRLGDKYERLRFQ